MGPLEIVAVKVTDAPEIDGDPEVATVNVGVASVTVCVSGADVEAVSLVSPP